MDDFYHWIQSKSCSAREREPTNLSHSSIPFLQTTATKSLWYEALSAEQVSLQPACACPAFSLLSAPFPKPSSWGWSYSALQEKKHLHKFYAPFGARVIAISSAFKTKNNKDQGLGTSYTPNKLLADSE